MKQNEQTQLNETTTTSIGRKQQQHQNQRKPTKLMVKTKGIEITDMKEFLAKKKIEHAARLGDGKIKPDSTELHTQLQNCDIQRAQRSDEISG